MEHKNNTKSIPQYSIGKILLIWAAAAFPMGILGWLVAPALAQNPRQPGFERLAVLAVGLVWQFILTMFLLYRETGNFHWPTIRERLWLKGPSSPVTGEIRHSLWWWLIPVFLLTAVYELLIGGIIDQLSVAVFPFLAEPPGFSLAANLDTPEARAQLVGAWGIFVLFIVQALFNTFLGEELLFRGFLLPRMAGAFGKWDWVMNGLLFGLYHIHQPWVILSGAIEGILLFALPSRYFRSSWFGIVSHSGQSIYFAFLMLGLVLGLS
jgi:membrane protease YdiL (CAAX protease family)